jgi:glycosyltransferase involved in cell wall biosynthesis
VLFLPSAYESLSLSVLEAWQAGIPVLVNGKAAVLEGHCDRSGGGLAYQSREEFEQALSCMMESRSRRAQMGLLGRRYVDQTCSWTAVERQYHRALDLVGSESILHK